MIKVRHILRLLHKVSLFFFLRRLTYTLTPLDKLLRIFRENEGNSSGEFINSLNRSKKSHLVAFGHQEVKKNSHFEAKALESYNRDQTFGDQDRDQLFSRLLFRDRRWSRPGPRKKCRNFKTTKISRLLK